MRNSVDQSCAAVNSPVGEAIKITCLLKRTVAEPTACWPDTDHLAARATFQLVQFSIVSLRAC